jgi:hypothetical protein
MSALCYANAVGVVISINLFLSPLQQVPSEDKTYVNMGKQLSPDETDTHHDRMTRYTRGPTLNNKPDTAYKVYFTLLTNY